MPSQHADTDCNIYTESYTVGYLKSDHEGMNVCLFIYVYVFRSDSALFIDCNEGFTKCSINHPTRASLSLPSNVARYMQCLVLTTSCLGNGAVLPPYKYNPLDVFPSDCLFVLDCIELARF